MTLFKNIKKKGLLVFWGIMFLLTASISCSDKKSEYLFTTLDSSYTGLNFTNELKPTGTFNMFTYMYFYNGAGVGAGDFNKDGLVDLFFSANQGDNKIFLNEGKMHFRDVTAQAGIPQDHEWSTGVSVVDINNDGLLDIYICRVGNYESLHGKNQFLICQGIKDGIPYYKDEAQEYGLDFSGFSTQAAFFDYDNDGDLDMFLLNHSVHQNGTFAPRNNFLGTYHPLSGDRLFRNDGNKFTDVTRESAINSSAISYGLGIVVSDINLDGWPDIYAGNDFHENDYLYINQKNGTFVDESERCMMHTSMYSMGVDAGDMNNDGYPDIVSMDMLPSDPYMIRRSLGEDDYDIYNYKISAGYDYQYTRNNLQLNRRNGMFSEVGLYSGMYATDWSWSSLWMDFDNDGWKDLFISNGIPKRMNDIDYVNFVSNAEIQSKIKEDKIADKDLALVNKFPEIKLDNKFFRNNHNASFADMKAKIEKDVPTFSNGAVYADLDNDGDLDVVTNNVNEPALIYENRTSDQKHNHYINLQLKGTNKNINALGSKVFLFSKEGIRNYENYPVHGFQSSMQIPLHLGMDSIKTDSAFLVWPDNSFQYLPLTYLDTTITITYRPGLPAFDYSLITGHYKNKGEAFEDITASTRLAYKHKENFFPEFNREPLIPHMVSAEGPALAVADINHDGTDDFFIGSSKTSVPAIFIQKKDGTFKEVYQKDFHADSTNEETGASWADINNDGNPDLIVANGGNEYYGRDAHLTPCIYLNDGTGRLSKLDNPFDSLFINASCVCPYDFNGDGYTDLFIGGRTVPWEYGQAPRSYILVNDKNGHFTDVTNTVARDLSSIGMVTDARWFDIDKDGDKDLLVTCEWGGITAFMNENGKLVKKELTDRKGWWDFLLPIDIDNDGDIDLVAGNLGLNSRLKASREEPVRLYYNDFDNNGKNEQVLTYYLDHQEIPFTSKDELQRQIPIIKKKYLYAEDFAKASLEEIFTPEKLSGARLLTADYFANAILINDGNLNFETIAMPAAAQFSTLRTAAVLDANSDGLPDLLLLGNYYENTIQMGRSDADFGTILINKGKGNFEAETITDLVIKGQVKHVAPVNIKKRPSFLVAVNNDSIRIIAPTLPGNKGG